MFPRTTVGGLSLSRMLIGTNWMLGYSHRSVSQDQMIKNRYSRAESFQPMFDAYMEYGIDTIMGPISQNQIITDGIRLYEERTGKKLILVDTPIINVDDTSDARREAEATIRASAEVGSAFCLIHHSSAEQLVNKNTHELVRLGDYTDMIRQAGMRPGLSAHMPELIVYSDEQGYDVETYIQIYNCMGFLMQVEIETVAAIIQKAKKPVMTIKSMAAGRVTPFVGLTFSWNTIREQDMLTLGAYSPDEVHEDVEISLAALEHRFPQLERRSSPAPDQAAFGD